MQTLRRTVAVLPLALRLVLVVAVAFVLSAVIAHAPHFAPLAFGATVPLSAMVTIPWSPALTKDQLDALSNPSAANEPEVVPWQLYDTQAIANAAAGPFVYFTALNTDKTLCNMEGPGQLPDPQYFVVQYVACDILQAPTATVLTSEPNQALANVENLLKTVRASFTFNMSNKRYGPFSLTMCQATGGATGFGYGYGTAASGTSAAAVNNGAIATGGFPFCGALIIPPKTGFDVTLQLAAAATLSATVNVRMSLVGQLYRRVL